MSTASCAVALDHLNRYTGGNRDLNEEILRLFEGQCLALVGQLEALAGGEDGRAWHVAAHTLKGASRGIGAFALEDAAQSEEAEGPNAAATAEALVRLRNAGAEVQAFITAYLANV